MNEHKAERAIGGFLYCLRDLADFLADNVSLGELFRTKREEIEKAFGGLDKLSRVKTGFRYFLRIDDPVEIASQSETEHATVWAAVSQDKERTIRGDALSEVIAIKIHWRFTNSEIAKAIRKLVPAMRPQGSEPVQRKKGSKQESLRSALDALSAMRLASYLPKTAPQPTPGALSAWLSGASPELKQSAIDVFDRIRLGGRDKPIAESNFDALIVQARKAFKASFPFGEDAANAVTLKDRTMMKS